MNYREQEIIANYRCPKCKAKAGDPCTYVSGPTRWDLDPDTGRHQRAIARFGQPTKRVHRERHYVMYWAEKKEAQDEEQRKWELQRAAAMTAVVQLRRLDLDEYRQMQTWLKANYRLFDLKRRNV